MKRVTVGTTVTVEVVDTGERHQYTLVPAAESDAKRGRISIASPIGKAVLAREVGDRVTVQLPKGPRSYEIVEVAYDAQEMG